MRCITTQASGINALHIMTLMYLFTTVPHPHGHWQLQELLGNREHMDFTIMCSG